MPNTTVLISILSLIIAALAVVFGPIIQLFIAKAQIRASVLSANRQRWIDTLREELTEFITATVELNVLSHMHSLDGQTAIEKTRKMQLCLTKISLMLNPLETDHQQLLTLLKAAAAGVHQSKEDKTNVPAIMSLSQTILKREWERVKATK
jgi:Icc-related predicted phosphoesterase